MEDLQITAKEHIELIIENGTEGWFDHIEALAEYPVDAVLPHYEKVDKRFIRPAGWALLSENDKAVKLLGWLKSQIQRPIEVKFNLGVTVEYALKYLAIQLVEYTSEKIG